MNIILLLGKLIDNLTITASGVNKTLDECTWAEINEISTAGRAQEFFKISDTKDVYLSDYIGSSEGYVKHDIPHKVRIIGFNHDDLVDGSGNKAGITFEFENVISDRTGYKRFWYWSVNTNAKSAEYNRNYDYRGFKSKINPPMEELPEYISLDKCLNDEEDKYSCINMLPEDLAKVIKPVNKLVGVNEDQEEGKDNYEPTPFKEGKYPKLFPLAYDEMHEPETEPTYVVPGEAGDAGIYEYYKGHGGDEEEDKAYRIKKATEENNSVCYWLRSPYISSTNDAVYVDDSGSMSYLFVQDNSSRPGTAPAFCI